jgi:hypothetical protein
METCSFLLTRADLFYSYALIILMILNSSTFSTGKRIQEEKYPHPNTNKTREQDKEIILPRRKIRILRGLVAFHEKLIEYAMIFEFRRESIEGSIDKIKNLISKTVPAVKEFPEPAKVQLRLLNDLLEFQRGRLDSIKEMIKVIYDTNELIINNVVVAASKLDRKTVIKQITEDKEKHKHAHPDLPHGGTGWMLEYEVMKHLHKEGKPVFLTFGTHWDPAKVDIIALEAPFSTKIKFGPD